MRRLLVAMVVGGMLVAAVATSPATAQQAPVIGISPFYDTAGAAPATWSITVNGSGWGSARVTLSFAGSPITSVTPTNGSFSTTINPTRRGPGAYAVTANGNPCAPTANCPSTHTQTFRSALVTLSPACRSTSPQTLTVTAQGFTPGSYGYVYYDLNGPEEQARFRLYTGNNGSFSTTFSTTASGRAIDLWVYDLDEIEQRLNWPACPPETTTTTTSTTVPDSVPDTTTTSTTRPSGGGVVTTTTSTTIPTIVTIPPPTPGAALLVTPPLGPGGFVTTAIGSGFPANQPVTLGWSPGIGIYSVTAGPDGTFMSPVLIMNRDVLGPRTLVATSGEVSASASFLVVPSTVQPSGKDVAQINRVRRFLQR